MHPTSFLHVHEFQRCIEMQSEFQIIATTTFQCYFGAKSPAMEEIYNLINDFYQRNSKINVKKLTMKSTGKRYLWMHVQPKPYPIPQRAWHYSRAHAIFLWEPTLEKLSKSEANSFRICDKFDQRQ